ncbi:MAG: phosphoenolpyruvate--protein phosphotransferase [Lachnospiraceae bacterium]|nr:phosphoenolpyruvate--protein phosphotransferase [Lachnospiraceae bacterium]
MKRLVLKGTPVVAGVAMGSLCFIGADYDALMEAYEPKEGEEEFKRYLDALEAAKESLSEAASREGLSEEEQGILEMHLMLLDDDSITDAVKDKVADGMPATKALEEAVVEIKEVFAGFEDEYLRDRANDIEDVGRRILRKLLGIPEADITGDNLVLAAEDIEPALMASLSEKQVKAVILANGSKTSHSIIIAKSKGFVTIVGVDVSGIKDMDGSFALVDTGEGEVILNPTDDERASFEAKYEKQKGRSEYLLGKAGEKAVSLDGVSFKVAANVSSPSEMEKAVSNGCEGVGLYRTEFLFMDSDKLPDEEKQVNAYRQLLSSANGELCIIRTLDIGGDKKCDCLDLMPEENPFLGYRAVRICLDKKDMFKTQLRALLRASDFGKLGIMVPMIDTITEIKDAKALFEEAKAELKGEGVAFDEGVLFGIMTETPASAMMADVFAKHVDFFSIGTNDLVQYTMAVDRGNQRVSYLYDYFDPAVIRAIYRIISAAKDAGILVGMCGEMAGDELATPLLMAMGLEEFSMSVSSAPAVKEAIRTHKCTDVDLEKVLALESASEVRDYLGRI